MKKSVNRVMNQLASHPFLSTGLGFLSMILQFLSVVFGFVFLGFHKNDFGGNWMFCFQKFCYKRSQGCRFVKISYVFFPYKYGVSSGKHIEK
jgi:hypothetical protein